MIKTKQEIINFLKERNTQDTLDYYSRKFKNKSVILYGAGLLSEILFENYDLSGINIVAIADSKSNNTENFYNIKKCSPDKIEKLNPDNILICTYDDSQIKVFLKNHFPATNKIKKDPIIRKTFKDKITFFLECCC